MEIDNMDDETKEHLVNVKKDLIIELNNLKNIYRYEIQDLNTKLAIMRIEEAILLLEY